MEREFLKRSIRAAVKRNPDATKKQVLKEVMKEVKKSEPLSNAEVKECEELVFEMLGNFIQEDE